MGLNMQSMMMGQKQTEEEGPRKVRTVDALPQATTIMGTNKGMKTIAEEKRSQEDSSDDGSSIDCEGDDLEKLEMKAMQQTQEESKSLDDLIDKELTELLKVCKNLRPSTQEELEQRAIKMGEKKR